MKRVCSALLAGAALAAASAFAADDDPYPFMPPGGRALLEALAEAGGLDLAAETAREDDLEGWRARAGALGLEGDAAATLAAYAALNLPISEGADLPPDGKDLAVAQCQYCHSLFSGYLMQRRDEAAWLGTFKSPFHSEIPMSDVERATFAAYSAINMPLAFEDVPPELRF